MAIWTTAAEARALGCTHHARIFGIIPGFYSVPENIWVPRSDLLNPVEDALAFIWTTMRQMRGDEPDFMFSLGREIKGGA